MNICLFSQEEINSPLSIKDERAQHIIKILHKKVGDSFTAGIINGKSGIAHITEISDCIKFEFEETGDGKPLFPLNMIIGFPRPIQLKRLLRDIAALGVSKVFLSGTELGEKSYMQSTLVEKGNAYKMLLDGTVQAGSTHVPDLDLFKDLAECLKNVEDYVKSQGFNEGEILRIALDNVNPSCSLSECFAKDNIKCVLAAIGSERGWTNKERDFLEKNNFIRAGMGQRIMRTETACTVAGSIILEKMGRI